MSGNLALSHSLVALGQIEPLPKQPFAAHLECSIQCIAEAHAGLCYDVYPEQASYPTL